MATYTILTIDALILFALVCGAYWKLTLIDDYTWANQPDMADQVLPWLQFQAREWHAGRPWPLWDPHHWGGQSLIGQIQPGVMYPLNWLLFLMAKGSITLPLLGWYLVIARYMGAIFFYWLVRDCGRSRMAAIFGGVLFACTGYVGTTEWPQVVNGAIWAPLVAMFGFRMLRGRGGSAPWLGFALGMSVLAGHYQVPFQLAILAGVLIVAAGWRWRSWQWSATGLLITGVFAFLVGAAQILPAQEYWSGAMRWVGAAQPLTWKDKVPFAIHAADSLDPVSVVGVVVPRIYSALSNPYAGFVVLVLALFAVVSGWRSFRIRAIAAILLLFLLISLGAATWMYGVAYALIPGFETSRHPATAVVVWHMCLVLLACFGFDRLRRVRVAFVARTAGLLAIFALFVYGTMVYLSLANPTKVFGRNEQSMAALTALALSALLFGFLRGALPFRFTRLGCLAIALVEVSNVAGYTYMHRSSGWEHLRPLFEDGDIAEFLRKDPGFVRVNFDRGEIPYNFGDWWGVDQYQGYTGVSEHLFRQAFQPETQKLFGVTHQLSKSANLEGRTPVFRSQRGIYVYRLGSGRHQWLEHTACTGESVVWNAVTHPGYWRMKVELGDRCEGILSVNEAWTPGWSATVNGRPAPVDWYAGFLKGVRVGPVAAAKSGGGTTLEIELRHAPGSAKLGATLSILGLVWLAVLTVPVWLKRANRDKLRLGRPERAR